MVLKRRDSDGFERSSILGALLMPFLSVKEWFGDAITGDDSFRDSQGNIIVRLVTLPFRLLWAFAVFMVQAWTTSRDGIAFLRGLPAFGIMAFTPFLIWGLNNYVRQISLGPTIGYHEMHLRNGAFDNALLFSKKMVELRPDDKEFKYMLAEDQFRAGDEDGAGRLMEYLAGPTEVTQVALETSEVDPNSDDAASDDSPKTEGVTSEENGAPESEEQFAQAHVWLAQQLLRKQQLGLNEGVDNTEMAMKRLRAAVAADPENIRAKVNLVTLYQTRAKEAGEGTEEYIENLKLAKESLLDLTDYQSFNRLEQVLAMPELVGVCVKLGDDADARRALNDATSKVTRIARLNPEIYQIWLSLVQSAVALKEYDRANDFIKEGYQSVKTQETRQKILQLASLVYIQNADDFEDLSSENEFTLRLYALCKAIATNPRDVRTYERLVDYIDVDEGGTERDVWLRNSILDCPIPGVVHIIAGTRELIRGDISGGKTSWDIAQHQFQSTEFVTHRLLSVAIRMRPKFGEGELLETALELFPDQHMLHETRGIILKEQGAYEEAIKEFKIVEKKMPGLITVHKHLKDCYEQTNNDVAARASALKVEEILDTLDEKERELFEKALKKL